VLKRLSCYDREVPRFLPRTHAAAPGATAATANAAVGSAGAAPRTPVAAAVPSAASDAPMPQLSARGQGSTASPPVSAKASRPVRARIASIERYPNEIVLHLDNGQVWQEIEDVSVELGVRVGDTVTIDRELGADWVTGRNGATARVRLKN
jgi:hypothetical protein